MKKNRYFKNIPCSQIYNDLRPMKSDEEIFDEAQRAVIQEWNDLYQASGRCPVCGKEIASIILDELDYFTIGTFCDLHGSSKNLRKVKK